jgi:hypothetical protein
MYTIDELKDSVNKSLCWSDVCRFVNVTICTYNFKRMQKLCLDNEINFDHFKEGRKQSYRRNKRNWESAEVYCKNSLLPRHMLRKRVLRDNFMSYSCSSCNNTGEWNGKKLTLEIEHRNGINDDNRVENLTWLCPNCHSQTPTFRNSSNRKALVA